jgi:hypothetical protein
MADNEKEDVKNVTVKSIFEEAENEIRKEKIGNAKRKIKDKLRQLSDAQRVVSNLKREVEELQLEIKQDLEG